MHLILLKHIKEILLYNAWANTQLLENLQKISDEDYFKVIPTAFNSIHGLALHISYYDTKYFYKLTSPGSEVVFNRAMSRTDLQEYILLYSQKWLTWVENISINEQLPTLLNEISQGFFDLTIHNNYHRGQLNEIAFGLGYKPTSLDIYLYRNL
jgi:uncharacterized damage-inducible protein DinB